MALRSLFLLLLAATPALAGGWGADVNTGAGQPLVDSARPELAAIVKAPEGERAALVQAFAEKKGADAIEAVKRFRNPELKAMFVELLKSADWKVKHRALFALAYFDGEMPLAEASELLAHERPRMREAAAIFLLRRLAATAPKVPMGVKGYDEKWLGELASKEEDPHVRACLAALAGASRGKVPAMKVSPEFTVTLEDGLILTPFLDGMDKAKSVAPGYAAKPNPRQGGGSASALPAAARWTTPLLAWREEEVSGVSLQPFANLRQNGTVYHTGLDVGACLDGAGYYAVAEGIVKFVHTGSDMGTLIVTEHNAGDDLACAVSMHGGDTVFVKAGDRVACGQLLGTMGMSYSIENGGHYAHLHFGLYPGAFSATHNYGYKQVTAGLADWHDPATWLPQRIEATAPLVDGKGLDAAAAALLEKEDWAKAHALGGEAAKRVEAGVELALKRAEGRRDAGYPKDALDALKKHAGKFKGVPGAEKLGESAAAWEKDAAFKKALEAEKAVAAAEAQSKKLKPEQAKAAWEALLQKYGDTVVAARIKAKLK